MTVPGYRFVSCALAMIPGTAGMYLRRWWYKRTLVMCGKRLFVDWMAVLRAQTTEVGDDVYVGPFCWVGVATIGSGVMLSGFSLVLSGLRQHGTWRSLPMHMQVGQHERITIGADCWIGAGAIVAADIAPGTVVGAGAVVVTPTRANMKVAGNPAREIGERT